MEAHAGGAGRAERKATYCWPSLGRCLQRIPECQSWGTHMRSGRRTKQGWSGDKGWGRAKRVQPECGYFVISLRRWSISPGVEGSVHGEEVVVVVVVVVVNANGRTNLRTPKVLWKFSLSSWVKSFFLTVARVESLVRMNENGLIIVREAV